MLVLAKQVTETTGMSDDLKGAIITAIVTGIISLIGFIITYTSMKKSFKNELMKQRDTTALEKMSTIPFEILQYQENIFEFGKISTRKAELENRDNINESEQRELDILKDVFKDAEKNIQQEMKNIHNTIYAYGSIKAIRIISAMQSENYLYANNMTQQQRYRQMGYMVLLCSQVKKDVTAVVANPKFWYEMKITDYYSQRDKVDIETNKIVKELDLDKEFLIK